MRLFALWRLSSKLYRGGIKLLAHIVEIVYNILAGNAISGRAVIGKGTVFFHRGVGCVVHRKAVIGENCNIMQNVTIGERFREGKRGGCVPKIGNNVTIGAGAVLLGGIKVGNNAIIGANAVVLTDVPDSAIAVGVPAVIKEQHGSGNGLN